jgi:hypothetical protein
MHMVLLHDRFKGSCRHEWYHVEFTQMQGQLIHGILKTKLSSLAVRPVASLLVLLYPRLLLLPLDEHHKAQQPIAEHYPVLLSVLSDFDRLRDDFPQCNLFADFEQPPCGRLHIHGEVPGPVLSRRIPIGPGGTGGRRGGREHDGELIVEGRVLVEMGDEVGLAVSWVEQESGDEKRSGRVGGLPQIIRRCVGLIQWGIDGERVRVEV